MYMQEGRGLQEIGKNYSLKISECSVSVCLILLNLNFYLFYSFLEKCLQIL